RQASRHAGSAGYRWRCSTLESSLRSSASPAVAGAAPTAAQLPVVTLCAEEPAPAPRYSSVRPRGVRTTPAPADRDTEEARRRDTDAGSPPHEINADRRSVGDRVRSGA